MLLFLRGSVLCCAGMCKGKYTMTRKAAYPVVDLILNRWSARAMSGELVSQADLMSLFEAARWAPSSYNNQPWTFCYAMRHTDHWQTFFDLLVPFNQSWAKDASVLIVAASRTHFVFNGKPSRTHSYDVGAACQNLALQGYAMGLVVHAIEGFDYDKAAQALKLPEGHVIEVMFAVGLPGAVTQLPKELQGRETPSDRKPITEFVREGCF